MILVSQGVPWSHLRFDLYCLQHLLLEYHAALYHAKNVTSYTIIAIPKPPRELHYPFELI